MDPFVIASQIVYEKKKIQKSESFTFAIVSETFTLNVGVISSQKNATHKNGDKKKQVLTCLLKEIADKTESLF